MELIERLRLGGPNAAEVAGEAADELERLLRTHPNPADHRYWEGRYRDEKAEVDRLREKLESEIIAAYERGAEWTRENPNSSKYVKKAARDYADKITSPLNT